MNKKIKRVYYLLRYKTMDNKGTKVNLYVSKSFTGSYLLDISLKNAEIFTRKELKAFLKTLKRRTKKSLITIKVIEKEQK